MYAFDAIKSNCYSTATNLKQTAVHGCFHCFQLYLWIFYYYSGCHHYFWFPYTKHYTFNSSNSKTRTLEIKPLFRPYYLRYIKRFWLREYANTQRVNHPCKKYGIQQINNLRVWQMSHHATIQTKAMLVSTFIPKNVVLENVAAFKIIINTYFLAFVGFNRKFQNINISI